MRCVLPLCVPPLLDLWVSGLFAILGLISLLYINIYHGEDITAEKKPFSCFSDMIMKITTLQLLTLLSIRTVFTHNLERGEKVDHRASFEC